MKPIALRSFKDKEVKAAYDKATQDSASSKDAFAYAAEAYRLRSAALDRGPLLEAACRYLVLAQNGVPVGDIDPERAFHYAANAFRDAGLLQRAAECYFNSALLGLDRLQEGKNVDIGFSARSAGRAKALFAEIGDDDLSDQSYVAQSRLKQAIYRKDGQHLLVLAYVVWDLLSEFGTSANRWAKWLGLTIVVFAVAYRALWWMQLAAVTVEHEQWGGALTAVYLSVGNLFQFGTLGTLNPNCLVAQMVCMLHGVVAFVMLGTGATFLTRR